MARVMARQVVGSGLAGLMMAMALSACGTAVGTGAAMGPGGLNALGRAALGGDAYAGFKIAPSLPNVAGDRERVAVKLTYLMTDDTAHQSPQSQGMLAMLDDLPQSKVHNVVFRDGAQAGDSRLYYIAQGDTDPKNIRNPQSPVAPGVNEVQSNNPKVLSQVLAWTLDNYAGKRKYMQIYTHGAGVMGIGTDSNQTDMAGKVLPKASQIWATAMPQFAEAMRQGLKGRKLDAIYFRACLMGNVEALYELRGQVRYALASEDVSSSVTNSNLTMTRLFDDLAAKDVDPADLVKQMAIQAHAKHPTMPDGSFSGYNTMAAIDIEQLDELKTAINELSKALIAAFPKEKTAILAAYDAVPNFGDNEKLQRDLWAFAAKLDQNVKDANVQRGVDRVRDAQRKAMVHAKDAFGDAANGLSIFMPPREGLDENEAAYAKKFLAGKYQELRFTKDTGWDSFLKIVAAGGGN